ncbi:MAG: hypothetical protein NTZ55_00715 [Candidatus Roizmanbacteria bacterium]|nr:hypothetical protein [Candidatus Roizmanbacteria bacterium]
MKKIVIYLLTFLFIAIFPLFSYAQENNKVGISLLQPTSEDFIGASALTNGSTGDWGYVTLVIQENDRDVRKWQDIFENLRDKHLIPIVRLATSPQGEVWRRPEEKDAKEWVDFLNKLNWVIKKRYIVLFNEPNHATEWGGEVDPENYGKVAATFAKSLKDSHSDYIIMPAGMDAAAPSYPPQYEDSGIFTRKMFQVKDLHLEEYIDAWASHSYPNPGFSGSVWDTGKKSIRGYEYELSLLKELGFEKDFPVFITETGWKEGKMSESAIAENYAIAFSQIWGQDKRIQAVTPFVFKYLSEPFISFSWVNEGGYSAQYNVIKDLTKQKGTPEQIQKGMIMVDFPKTLIARSTYHFSVYLKNEGQAIWSQDDQYSLSVKTDSADVQTLTSDIRSTKPSEESKLSITIKTPPKPQTIRISLLLEKNGKSVLETKNHSITIEPFPELTVKTSLFPKFVSNGDGFEVQLFNKEEELVFSKKGLSMRKGNITIEDISDIIPGQQYRVVLLGYPYIPRQLITTLNKGINEVSVKRLLPFDADGNGRCDLNDIKTAILNPNFFLRFIPWREV